jgi:hypothetical protein
MFCVHPCVKEQTSKERSETKCKDIPELIQGKNELLHEIPTSGLRDGLAGARKKRDSFDRRHTSLGSSYSIPNLSARCLAFWNSASTCRAYQVSSDEDPTTKSCRSRHAAFSKIFTPLLKWQPVVPPLQLPPELCQVPALAGALHPTLFWSREVPISLPLSAVVWFTINHFFTSSFLVSLAPGLEHDCCNRARELCPSHDG